VRSAPRSSSPTVTLSCTSFVHGMGHVFDENLATRDVSLQWIEGDARGT
jgi:hypothetical protein